MGKYLWTIYIPQKKTTAYTLRILSSKIIQLGQGQVAEAGEALEAGLGMQGAAGIFVF